LRNRIVATLVAATTLATALFAAVPGPAHAAGEKVVLIVGPVGGQTNSFRSNADDTAAAATAAGAQVVKVYSPSATWSAVKAAVNGANIVVYFGHGNGFPSPYSSTQNTDRVNGWGLNRTTTNGDGDNWSTTMVYCGEKALRGTLTSSDGAAQRQYCSGGPITPAPGWVMVYAGACYAPGASESWDTVPTHNVALQRVSNYSRPVLNLGGTYFATDHGAASLVTRILQNPNMSFGDIYNAGRPSGTFTDDAHLSVGGARAWTMQTSSSLKYTYAFAGNPSAKPNGGAVPSSVEVDRYAGSDRYATAAQVSAAHYSPGVPVAYVATGANFPDALAGGVPAALRGGPVLLVSRDQVPPATAAELDRLNPGEIVVLGGTGVVSDGVAAALSAYSGTVRRLAGPNRYATAAAISSDYFAPGVPVAFIATGANFPDALAGVAAAAHQGGPILLVTAGEVPGPTATELQRLAPGRIVILGGTGVVSNAVASALDAYTTGPVERYAGSDRYATATAISSHTWSSSDLVYVATGLNFPDALAGAPGAGMNDAPLLLVTPTGVPASVQNELLRLGPDRVVVLGGTGVVSPSVVYQIQALFPAA
jgi:putative cell wall-binding protein